MTLYQKRAAPPRLLCLIAAFALHMAAFGVPTAAQDAAQGAAPTAGGTMVPYPLAVGADPGLAITPTAPPPAPPTAIPTPETAPCGYVDGIDYPIDITDSITRGYDDFALLRPRFGGRHTGIDIGFNRRGDPVFAAARGRVTYADVNGWDTEKGVVIVEHMLPDDSIAYTLYGHMEVSDTISFPAVGECVERGSVVGLIGWPSRGLPHLHYEIRNFLPNDGGPGYVVGNPLLEGWYHPLDFTETWRLRFTPAYIGSVTFNEVPSLPPALLDSGTVAIASGSTMVGFDGVGTPLWRIDTPGVITGLAALPGDRVAVHTREGQAFTVQGGRFASVWEIPGPEIPFIVMGEALVFVNQTAGLSAYTPQGELLWTAGNDSAVEVAAVTPEAEATFEAERSNTRVLDFEQHHGQIMLALRDDTGTRVRVFERASVVFDSTLGRNTALAPTSDGWLALTDGTLIRISGGIQMPLAAISPMAGRAARLTSDVLGNVYLYLSDIDNTLLSLDANGETRWRVSYPAARSDLAPLLAVGGGCMVYALDASGWLNTFDTASGALLSRIHLYPGGVQNGSPRARMLQADLGDRLLVGAGFLTTAALDGRALGGEAMAQCRLG